MKQYNTFFYCQNTKFLWRLISAVFNLLMLLNVNHMFTHWLNGLRKQCKHQALVWACAILWAIWLTRNDITFNYARLSSFFASWFRFFRTRCAVWLCFRIVILISRYRGYLKKYVLLWEKEDSFCWCKDESERHS